VLPPVSRSTFGRTGKGLTTEDFFNLLQTSEYWNFAWFFCLFLSLQHLKRPNCQKISSFLLSTLILYDSNYTKSLAEWTKFGTCSSNFWDRYVTFLMNGVKY
jgi:hypothetical protein